MKELNIIGSERGLDNTMEKNKEVGMKSKVDEMYDNWKDPKTKKIKIPRKAKVKKRRIKKGWVGVFKIDENGNLSGEKQKIAGFTFKTKDRLYHTTDGREILWFNGKFPVVLQPSWKLNPIEIRKGSESNETYGQPYTMARMMNDTIKSGKKGGSIILYIVLAIGALYGINYFIGGA